MKVTNTFDANGFAVINLKDPVAAQDAVTKAYADALAQTNEMKIGTKADQVDLETAEQQVELNRLAILTKADIAALALLK